MTSNKDFLWSLGNSKYILEKVVDQDEYGGGILVYEWEDIPSKLIPMQSSSIEGLFV